ncbi:hypothetical protein B0H16DRAFT_1812585 [Mycena metata]|uniref:Mid2 domain-containing protein n=1 Tax=Mycena metata TaxID=1033252 RepID=A0AAD7JDK1_9AGAR|nr:hypothetical protein B0H16DRAFT_1812585 [Mycena metata]
MFAHCIVAFFAFFARHSFATLIVDAPILSASSPNPSLANLGSSPNSSIEWIVDITPGTSAIAFVQDSTGDSGQSAPFVIGQRLVALGGTCGGNVKAPTQPVSPTAPSTTADPTGGHINDPGGGGSTSSDEGGPQSTSTSDPSPTSSDDGKSNSDSTPSNLPPSSTFSSTSVIKSSTETAANFNSNFTSESSSASNGAGALTPPNFSFSGAGATGGAGGQIQPAATSLQSGGASSSTTGQSGQSNSFTKKNVTLGPIIGGAVAGVLCVSFAAFCLIRRCRRQPADTPDMVYPFTNTSSTARQVAGRSYAASISSWGNHGDLEERALSPTSPGSSEGNALWDPAQGTIESRYHAAFTPGHNGSSSSIDRNDPSFRQRFRGPIPKSMTDAYNTGPSDSSAAILGEQSYDTEIINGNPMQTFDEIRPQVMPSWGTMHDVMGREPVVGFPPPYTSR